jgi:hypothetical protein
LPHFLTDKYSLSGGLGNFLTDKYSLSGGLGITTTFKIFFFMSDRIYCGEIVFFYVINLSVLLLVSAILLLIDQSMNSPE